MSDREDTKRASTGAALGQGRATQLLERIGRLAQQARRTAEQLAERLLPGSGALIAPDPVRKPEPMSEAVAAPVGEPPPGTVREPVSEPPWSPEPEPGPERVPEPRPAPREPGEARVVLVARDPEWLFCYWDLERSPRPPGSRLTLRLQDVTEVEFDGTNGWSQHLYPLTDEARWWHVPVPHAGRHYLAEVGYCSPEGTFSALGRSHGVAALTSEPAAAGAVELATVDVDAPPPSDADPTAEGSLREGADLARPSDTVAPGPVHRPAAGPQAPAPSPGTPGALDKGIGPGRSQTAPSSFAGGSSPDRRLAAPSSAALSHPGSSAPWSRQR